MPEIGDRVIMRSDLQLGKRYKGLQHEYGLTPIAGKIVTIIAKMFDKTNDVWCYRIAEDAFVINEEMIRKDI